MVDCRKYTISTLILCMKARWVMVIEIQRIPNHDHVYAKILMSQNVPHSTNLPPWHFGHNFIQIRHAEIFKRLAYNLEISNHGILILEPWIIWMREAIGCASMAERLWARIAGANPAMKGSSLIGIYRIGWEDFPEAPLKGFIIRMGLAGAF